MTMDPQAHMEQHHYDALRLDQRHNTRHQSQVYENAAAAADAVAVRYV